MLQDILTDKKSLFADGVHTELRGQKNRTRRAVLLNGALRGNVRSDVSGVSARVYENGVYGFSSMAEYNGEAAETVLKAATENAAFMNKHAGAGKSALPKMALKQMPTQEDIRDAEQKLYVDYAREVDAYIAKKYPNLISRTVVAMEDSMEKLIVTSDGASGHILAPRSYAYVVLTAQTDAGTPVELFQAYGGRGVFGENFADPDKLHAEIDDLYEKLMQKREGVYANAGEKNVILYGLMSGMLSHEAVGHTVEADLVLGGSVAGPNLNKRVASDLITLTDFAHTAFGETCPLPVYIDDEGTEATDSPLIVNGILTGYMNNRESAQHFGMTPQGNARAWLFSD
ncbi:MAG: TldD/PmbA family protein, partial [Clostridia bacterium]|nr:TldD/PmbA family protein [Clostridia bacterium]